MSMSKGGRPAKRRRLETPVPVGFIQNIQTKSSHRVTLPKFSSAFDDSRPTKGKEPENRLTSKHTFNHLTLLSKHGDADLSKPRSSNDRPFVSVKDIHKTFALEFDKPVHQPLPAPPPPPLQIPDSLPPKLKQIKPPAFPISRTPAKALKPLQLPSVSVTTPRKVSAEKGMLAISKTALGLLNDLSSENGTEELASVLLRNQNPQLDLDFGHGSANRGLGLSPEKKGKGKTGRFIRGGLAGRASAFYDRSHTSLVLWQKEIELSKAPFDLSVTVVKILHQPIPSCTSTHSTPGIALCRIHHHQSGISHTYSHDQLYQIAFSFSRISPPVLFREGQTVRIYRPWQEISSKYDQAQDGAVLPRLLASLPLPSSEPSGTLDLLDVPINDTALACSRFLM